MRQRQLLHRRIHVPLRGGALHYRPAGLQIFPKVLGGGPLHALLCFPGWALRLRRRAAGNEAQEPIEKLTPTPFGPNIYWAAFQDMK